MGQYFKPILLKGKTGVVAWLYSHDYNNGLKLMEHSYIGNGFVRAVENLLVPGGPWYKGNIVWAGDYAAPEKRRKGNLYDHCTDTKKIFPSIGILERNKKSIPPAHLRYLVNHTKKLYVDYNKVPVDSEYEGYAWKINPLPLLTRESEEGGGGDYHGNNKLVGTWARHSLSIENAPPKNYTELFFNVRE